ncbi:MAG: ABC transporter ATP-binding protein, partial [Planctomycetota bacterium]
MPPDERALLTLRDVRFGFPARPDFLGPISLAVAGGECWAIVGPNGAGKSTLLRLMAGLHTPHAGEVEI